MILNFEERYAEDIINLWNISAIKDGYKELSRESFNDIFLDNPYFSEELAFVRIDDSKVTGFACGCVGDDLPYGKTAGYLTCIVLAPEIQSAQSFAELLDTLHTAFKKQGKVTSEVLFFNPMMLPWYIEDTPKHEHNNAPGAPTDTFYFEQLCDNGYFERTREAAMYLDLSRFEIPDDILNKENKALSSGYTVELFDKSKHFGVQEMLNGFDNPLWKKEITECTEKGTPVVIAAKEGKVVGFAGPVIRQKSGRGYFAGIGVHPEHEGHGLGSILFFKLCKEFKNIGTEYMSLYTGKNNPAINIYLKAGFRVVREFAVLRKEWVVEK